MDWRAEAWAGLACYAAGGILGVTSVIVAVFGWPPWRYPPPPPGTRPLPAWRGAGR